MTGVKPDLLNTEEMPKSAEYIWRYYIELKNAGDVNFVSIRAYSDLMGLDLQPSEVSMIIEFEKKYRMVV